MAAYILRTNHRHEKKPILPVNRAKVREIMAMYAKYKVVGTTPVIVSLEEKYQIE